MPCDAVCLYRIIYAAFDADANAKIRCSPDPGAQSANSNKDTNDHLPDEDELVRCCDDKSDVVAGSRALVLGHLMLCLGSQATLLGVAKCTLLTAVE